MDCPKCNREMVLGYIQSRKGILWSTRKRKVMVCVDSDDDVWVGDGNLFVLHNEAFRCPECGTIVITPTNDGNTV